MERRKQIKKLRKAFLGMVDFFFFFAYTNKEIGGVDCE